DQEAVRDWRNCLRANPRYLSEIIVALGDRLANKDEGPMRRELFAEDPTLLKKAADVAIQAPLDLVEVQERLLADGAAVLSVKSRTPEEDWLLGVVDAKLDKDELALDAMNKATEARHRRTDWGIEFAKRLLNAGKADEAMRVARRTQALMANPGELD